MQKEKPKAKFKLIECEPELPKPQSEADDELRELIRSINEMGRKSRLEGVQSTEPEPPPLVA